MALTVTFDGVNVTKAEDLTNWSNSGISGPNLWTDEINLQGNSCVGFLAANKSGYGVYTSPVAYNFQTTYAGYHVFMWVNITMPGTIKALSEGGLYLIAGTDTSNYNKYLIASKEDRGVLENGFRRFVFDPTLVPTEAVGTVNLSSIKVFGIWIDTGKTARIEQVFIDRIDIGRGLKIKGSSSNFWEDLLAADVGESSGIRENMYGVVQKKEGAYCLYGGLTIGDSEGYYPTVVSDMAKNISFIPQKYWYNGDWVSALNEEILKIKFVDNFFGVTAFTDGTQYYSDSGKLGSIFNGPALHSVSFDASSLFNPRSHVSLYATSFYGLHGGIKLTLSDYSKFYSGVVYKCGAFYPGGTEVRGVLFSESSSTDKALNWCDTADVEDCMFSSNPIAIRMPDSAPLPYEFRNLGFSANIVDVVNASGGPVTIHKKGSSNPVTSIGDVDFMCSVTIAISGSVDLTGAEIRVYDLDSPEERCLGTELCGTENCSLPFFTYAGKLGNAVWLQIMLPGYKEYGQELIVPNNDIIFTAHLVRDPNT